jgi:hypothetical protein
MGVSWLVAMVLAQTLPPVRDAGVDGPPLVETAQVVPLSAAPVVIEPVRPTEVTASIDVSSQLGKRYRFIEAEVFLDGDELANRTATGNDELARSFRAFEGPIPPGPHTVTVTLTYTGRNAGPFTYLDNYRYTVTTAASFDARPGAQPAALDVVATERSGITVPVEERPRAEIRTAPNSSIAELRPGTRTVIGR